MCRKIRDFFNSLSEAQQAVITILGVVMVISAGWATAIEFIKNLSIASIVWYSIAILALICIFIVAFLTWWKKRNVEKIPAYLCLLDELSLKYIREFDITKIPPEDALKIAMDLGEYLNVNIPRIEQAFKNDKVDSKSKQMGDYELEKIKKNTERLIDPKNKTQDTLKLLLIISGIMDEHGVGLKKLKETPNYKTIFEKVRKLQSVLPSVETNIKIQEYFRWSTGYYSYLLGRKFVSDRPDILSKFTVADRVTNNIIVPQIEASTITLISAVRESLEKIKHEDDKK